MKKKLALLSVAVLLGSHMITANALVPEHRVAVDNPTFEGIVSTENIIATPVKWLAMVNGKYVLHSDKRTNDLYIGLRDDLKNLETVEFKKKSDQVSSGYLYHKQSTEGITMYNKDDGAITDNARMFLDSYSMSFTTYDNNTTRDWSNISSNYISVHVHNKASVSMGEGRFNVLDFTTDANGKSKTINVTLSKDGLDNGNNKIINVLPGEADTDAVNVSQLKEVSDKTDANTNRIDKNESLINDLDNRINNIGPTVINQANVYTDQRIAKAGAANAALSGLKYVDYDANHKFIAAASFGQYKGATAGAIGVAYQPNEDVLVHLGTTIGSEHMLNGGVSIRVGDSNKGVKANTKNLAKEMDMIKAENAELKAELTEIKAMLASK